MNEIQIGTAVAAGLVGGAAMLIPMYMGKASGMTSMDLLKMLGSMVAPKGSAGVQYGVGAMMHAMMSAVFGVIHATVLVAVDPLTVGAAVGWDALFGAVHGVMVIAALPVMVAAMHPLVKAGEMTAPGVGMQNYGRLTPVGALMGHVVFGLVAGGIYASAVL